MAPRNAEDQNKNILIESDIYVPLEKVHSKPGQVQRTSLKRPGKGPAGSETL